MSSITTLLKNTGVKYTPSSQDISIINKDDPILDIFDQAEDGDFTLSDNIKIVSKDSDKSSTILSSKEEMSNELNDSFLMYSRELFIKVLRLLEFRSNNNSKMFSYNYQSFLQNILSDKMNTPSKFRDVMLNFFNQNGVGTELTNIISYNKSNYKNLSIQNLFVFSMSFLIQNNDRYTGVIFIPPIENSNQICINITRLIIAVILKLLIEVKDQIDSYIIVHSKPFYKEGLNFFKLPQKIYNIQFFSDIEILSPITENFLSVKFISFTSDEEKEFFEENRNITKYKMKKIEKVNPLLKYYGITHGLVKIIRPDVIMDTTSVDVSYSYIF